MPASIPPDTPSDISLFLEDGKYIFRVGESRSIYVYDLDKSGKPTCTGECARSWLPVIASKGSQPVGAWTLVERSDNTKQWCYRNQPIYTYANDKSGETSGDGIDGVWHAVAMKVSDTLSASITLSSGIYQFGSEKTWTTILMHHPSRQ